MAWYIVATLDEIPPGGRKIVEVAGRSIGIFNVAGEFFALRNRCPHQGGPLCLGRLWGAVQARVPGAIEYSRPGEMLTCAWHGWEFDLRTGQSWCDPARLRVRRYATRVATGAALPSGAPPGLVPGPYVAETYQVVAEGQYLAVDVPAAGEGGARADA
jgi:3-phenylpropionate/trans-cinnamate dioxygenase ferredoxin subunit